MMVIAGAGKFAGPSRGAVIWVEQLRVPDLSAGTYCIPAGGIDEQAPHTEDEIYVVTAGRATLVSGGEEAAVGRGSVIYVPAGEMHRFTDIAEDLALLVVFGPAEYSRAAEG
ncbi:MAG TPA: cupin domain-containing protein [Streptosporangiaceae bacterium]|nr:cupin domain-containing protein [Streptosporangiaceae bacterium]